VGRTCGMHGGGDRCLQCSGWEALRRPRHRWEYNIKMDLREKGIVLI
jgi:hypothetical protein